jgi:CubicO group peptidase (beta-lactamase class C family)
VIPVAAGDRIRWQTIGPSMALIVIGLASALSCKSHRNKGGLSHLTQEQIASIDEYATAEMGREHIPGLAVGVYKGGQILLAKGYGLANVELNVPVKPETVFQSGSVGKQFVSTAVMMLVEEGKLGLDDSIVQYFPNAPPKLEADSRLSLACSSPPPHVHLLHPGSPRLPQSRFQQPLSQRLFPHLHSVLGS